jgi:outer membrane protein OmpA-like peptidoglycan-associated protein
MKRFIYIFPILLLLSGCFKKKQVAVSTLEVKKQDANWQKVGSAAKFDDDVDEFFLEDDEDGNVFDVSSSGQLAIDQELEMATLPLNEQSAEVIQFDFDRTEINPEEKEKIGRNAEHAKDILKDNPDAVVVVDGHSCKIAKNQTYNYMISQERAENVAKEYVKKGISREKVKPVGHGSSELLTNSEGKEAQSVNRRAETHFKRV